MFHVSFFLQQRGDRTGGWTFNLWNQLTDETQLRFAIAAMGSAIQIGTGLGCNVLKARYSQAGSFRIADEFKFVFTTDIGTDHDDNADYQTTAVNLRLMGAGKYNVNVWLSGIKDGFVFDAGRLNPAYNTSPSFQGIKTELTTPAKGWCLYALLKTRPKKLIESISNTGLVKSTAHGLTSTVLGDPTNPQVRVQRVKQNKYPNAIWSIVRVDADNFQLVGFDDPTPGGYKVKKAIVRPQVFGPVTIADVKPIRATSHRRGRPTDLLSGKAKAKV